MGVILGLLMISGICFLIYFAIDSSQCNGTERNHEAWLREFESFCKENGLNYTPEFERYKTDFGYSYKSKNELTIRDDRTDYPLTVEYWIDKSKNVLYFINERNKRIINLSIDSIKLYAIEGTVQYIPHVESKGKNVSVSGALIGGAIAGTAGMIVGATKDRGQITTRVEQKGSRDLVIYYVDDAGDNRTVKVCDGRNIHSFTRSLRDRIPDKDGEYIEKQMKFKEIEENNAKLNDTDDKNDDLKNRLKELKELNEAGLITDEEYALKRKQLLNI